MCLRKVVNLQMKPQRKNHKKSWKIMWGFVLPAILIASALLTTWAYAEEGNQAERTLREKRYYYKAFNRRDPFQSLITGDFEESELNLVDIYGVRLVGVLSGEMKRFAMLEDNNGYSYIVQAGDPVRHGHIVSVGYRTLVARVSLFGQTNSVTLRLEEGMGKGE